MDKNKVLTLFLFLFSLGIYAQYGNEWIKYDQRYYSFKIAKDGVYKIDYDRLVADGIPVESIHPNNFQIFGFEKEQAVWMQGGEDGSFDSGDFILFYAKKNTAWLDSLIYDHPNDVPNKYYPHYNDTITYFLTWNTSLENLRFKNEGDISFADYTPQPFFFKTAFKEGSNTYLEGEKLSGISGSTFSNGEGWFGPRISVSAPTNYQDDLLLTPHAYTGVDAPNAKVLTVSAGASDAIYGGAGNHHLRVQYGPSNIVVVDTVYTGFQKNNFAFEIPAIHVGAATTRIRNQLVNDLGVASDYQAVSFSEITYAHTPNLEGKSYYTCTIPTNSEEDKSRFDFTNFSAVNPWVFTVSGAFKRIPIVVTGSLYQAIIPNLGSGVNQEVVILDESQFIPITTIKALNGTGFFTKYEGMNFEKAFLIVTSNNLLASANEYKIYRESFAGGSNNVILADSEELNLQFGGGVPKHIMGLRRFVHFAYNKSVQKPTNLFIIGKGVREANEGGATPKGMRQLNTSYQNCFVPTFGYPASDMLITARLEGNLWAPLIPTGRIAAKSNEELQSYLAKVKEYELAQDPNGTYSVSEKLWQKEVLHFGGGSSEIEQSTFKYYLNTYKSDLESAKFGGRVRSYYKTVSDPVDPALLNDVTDFINRGVSMMTFFGHASADGFDQNIDDPSNWNNMGKYPLVVGNSCLTGNIFEPVDISASENYVLIQNKGAIAFLANVKQAFPSALNSYSKAFFKNVATDNYGGTLGEHSKLAIEALQSEEMSFSLQSVCNQMTLHGDPSLKVNSHDKPELEINNTSIFFTPSVIDLTVDSIDVNLVIYNLGQSVLDTFAVELRRTFPNGGGDSLYTKLVSEINYMDTVVFTIPFYTNVGVGINTFTATVDIPSFVEEQFDEVFNNTYSKQVLFDVDGIYPVWPYNFAVVPSDTVTVKASTVNPFADFATYRFEIDTTDLYNSPELRFKNITAMGGVIEVAYDEWMSGGSGMKKELILTDSMVYFWRVAVEDGDEYYWIEYSFQYIKGKAGWGQDHFFQFKNNEYLFLEYEREIRQRLFGPSFKTIDCDVYGNATGAYQFAYTLFHIDGSLDPGYGEYNFCSTNPQFLVAVIDPYTLKSWGTRWDNKGLIPMQNPTHNFGNANDNGACRNRVESHFGFYQNNPTQLAAFENMMLNEIPDSFYYLIYTSRFANYAEWDIAYPAVYDVFQALGSDSIYPGRERAPFILFGKIGNPAFTKEVYGQDLNEIIHFEDTLWGFDYLGEEASSIIGPAKKWDALYWQQKPMEIPTKDSTRLLISGIDFGGSATLLIDTLFTFNDSIPNLSTLIDANAYPYLQLRAQHWDSVGFTPAQIDSWHVLYSPVPEAALNGGTAGVLFSPADTIIEGQQIAVAFDVKNISDIPMDSILVKYWIEDASHQIIPISYPRQDSLRVGQVIRDTIRVSSLQLQGFNSLWVEINPYNHLGRTDQLEQYHFNNIGQIPFTVIGDTENPILDVTFNGYHILNGDIIDPYSKIIMTLKDENEFLIMNEEADTANFGIYLTDPNGVQKRLSFRNGAGEVLMEWIPANSGNKKFQIIYDAKLAVTGSYRLLVQGIDKSGNISGDFQYDIEFEVDLNSSITQLMNYPNPFSTQTQFVFTLTGATIPDEFTIQIMTVTGKVVREITVHELGPIKIGRNLTEYRWNGTDEYGDILANGVYLYRVIVKIDNENVDIRSSGADKYFTKEFGKMYIMR